MSKTLGKSCSLPSISRRRRASGTGVRLEAMGRREEMVAKFREIDVKGCGRVDFNGLKPWLKKQKPTITDRQCMLLFSRADTNGSGQIEFEEFAAYILASELMDIKRSKKAARATSKLQTWDGPEQLKVNGSWDRETRLALQEFLAVQDTPTAHVVKPARFVNGNMNASTVVVLQELLQQYGTVAVDREGGGSLVCGVWDPRTTRALHELLFKEGTPTALSVGEAFTEQKAFSKNSILALQEFLAMMRKGNGSALSLAR